MPSRARPCKWANVYRKVTMWFAWKMCFFHLVEALLSSSSLCWCLQLFFFFNERFFFRCVKHWNQHWNVFVFFSHISVALNSGSGFKNPLRSPGIVSCAMWLMGKLVSWIWNVWNVLHFFSPSSSHLCYDINQMPEFACRPISVK